VDDFMSEATQVAIIAGTFNVLAILASRWSSRREHVATQEKIDAVVESTNGMKTQIENAAHARGFSEGQKYAEQKNGTKP
jgi:hypothetical protein